MTFTFSLSNWKIFGIAFAFFSMLSIIIVYGIAPALHLSGTMGGYKHDGYLELATNISSGNGYVFEPGGNAVFHRPPAYVFMLVPGMYLPKTIQRIYIILLNSALAAATATLLRKMALFLTDSNWVAMISLGLFITNPWIIWSLKNPLAVILQMSLYALLSYLFILIYHFEDFGNRRTFYAKTSMFGIICGIASLSHGVMFPICLFVLSILVFQAIKSRKLFKLPALLLSLLIICSIILPWTIRNYKVTGRIIPVVGNTGTTYFGGNAYWGITNPPVQNKENMYEATLRHAGITLPYQTVFHYWGIKNPFVEKQINDAMVRHIQSHPLPFVKKIFLNGLGYYFPIAHNLIIPSNYKMDIRSVIKDRRNLGIVEAWVISFYHGALLLLSLCSIIWWKKSYLRFGGVVLMLLFVSLYALPYFPFLTFVGHSLYVFGTLPFLYLLIANFLVCIYFNLNANRTVLG